MPNPLLVPTSSSRTSPDPQFASTLERGLRVLQCFSSDEPLGNGEIALRTGLPKPTVSRLTYTLAQLGYLRRREDDGQFEIGPAALCLSYPMLARATVRRLARQHLGNLAMQVDGVAGIFVRDRLRMVALKIIAHRDVFKRRPDDGISIGLNGSTMGLCWLVCAAPFERDRLLRELAHRFPDQLPGVRADYDMGLAQLRRSGHVFRRDVLRPGTCTLAMPLPRRPGDDLYVLACSIDTSTGSAPALERRAARLLKESARRISEDCAKHR